MMESSEDKTVRKMISTLRDYEWLYQYSIFVDVNDLDIEDAKYTAKNWLMKFDDKRFRDNLRKGKENKNIGMMYVIRKTLHKIHPSKKSFQQFYITIFSTDVIHGIDNVGYYSDLNFNVLSRKVTEKKIESTCSALKNQKLHDISLLGGKKRYTILNRSKLKLIDEAP
jgi:hypothetical protein